MKPHDGEGKWSIRRPIRILEKSCFCEVKRTQFVIEERRHAFLTAHGRLLFV